jgi:hypothetical protein
MNERMQIIGYLLEQCDLKNRTIAELQAKLAALEKESKPAPTPSRAKH